MERSAQYLYFTVLAGIFDVAWKGSTIIGIILMAVNMPLAPAVASLYSRGERERLQQLVTKSARIALLGALPIAIALVIFGRWFLMVFGGEFLEGSNALIILSVGQLVNAGAGSVALLLNMTGHEQDTARGIGFAVLVNCVLSVVLIPLWGINGAAMSYAFSLATWNILLAVCVYKRQVFLCLFHCQYHFFI